jgi:urease
MSLFPLIEISEYAAEKMPGAIIVKKDSPIIINEGRARIRLRVTNNGCRPVQVSYPSKSVVLLYSKHYI